MLENGIKPGSKTADQEIRIKREKGNAP